MEGEPSLERRIGHAGTPPIPANKRFDPTVEIRRYVNSKPVGLENEPVPFSIQKQPVPSFVPFFFHHAKNQPVP